MDWICWVVPVKPGKTEVAREYCRALETTRRADYEASERELGIEREVFFLWTNPEGKDHIVRRDGPPVRGLQVKGAGVRVTLDVHYIRTHALK